MADAGGSSRRRLLKIGAGLGLTSIAAALAGCGEAQIVEKEVVKIVTQEVAVEKVVTQIVEKEKIVEKPVEKIVTQIVEKEKIVEKIVTVEAAQPKLAQVTITYGTWMGEIGTDQKELFDPFNKEFPHITIDGWQAPWGEYWTKIGTLIASGKTPDVFGQSVAYIWDYAQKGLALNLQPMVRRDINPDEHYTLTWDIARYPVPAGGEMYALPFRWVVSVLYFNTRLLDAAGVKWPDDTWTYINWEEAAARLTIKEGDKTTQWGLRSYTGHTYLDARINSNGGDVLSPDFKQCLLDQPKSLEMVQAAADLVRNGLSPTTTQVQGLGVGAFATGRVAMDIDGSYAISGFLKATDLPFEIALVPAGPVKRVSYGGPDSYAISAKTPRFEEAWELVKFSVGDKRGYASYGIGAVPALRKAAESPEWLKPGKIASYGKILESHDYLKGADFSSQWIQWRATVMNNELEPAFLGEKSVPDAVASATKAIQEILDKVIRVD